MIKTLIRSAAIASLVAAGTVGFSAGSFAQDMPMVGGAEMSPEKTIVETRRLQRAFSTLVAAVKAADLVEMLSSEGPFTVFAPTDEAFEKLPKGTLESLLKPENKEKLAPDPHLPRRPGQGVVGSGDEDDRG